MSNYVFPIDSFKSLDVRIKQSSALPVDIDTALSGKEFRSTWRVSPTRTYEISLNAVRTTYTNTAQRTLYDLLTQYVRHAGSLDSFLISMPDDNSIASAGFGKGDGLTTAFYLQRRQSHVIYDRSGGPWYEPDVPWYQYVKQSEGTWTATNGTVSTAIWLDPLNGSTAALFSEASEGSPHNHYMTVALDTLTQNTEYYISFWCSASNLERHPEAWFYGFDGGTADAQFDLTNVVTHSGSGTRYVSSGVVTSPVGGGYNYYRCWMRVTSGTGANGPLLRLYLDNSSFINYYTGVGGVLAFWGVQMTPVYSTSFLCPRVASTGAVVVTTPSYYPVAGGGFELIKEPIRPSIYVAGTLRTLPGDYSFSSSTGVVTFVSAPANNAALTWTGPYYRRVRFEQDLSVERIVTSLWRGQSIKLVGVL